VSSLARFSPPVSGSSDALPLNVSLRRLSATVSLPTSGSSRWLVPQPPPCPCVVPPSARCSPRCRRGRALAAWLWLRLPVPPQCPHRCPRRAAPQAVL
jgi:hypothetical protein